MEDIFGKVVVDEIELKEWEKEWQGMPEFKNEKLDCLSIVVHFKDFSGVSIFIKFITVNIHFVIIDNLFY